MVAAHTAGSCIARFSQSVIESQDHQLPVRRPVGLVQGLPLCASVSGIGVIGQAIEVIRADAQGLCQAWKCVRAWQIAVFPCGISCFVLAD